MVYLFRVWSRDRVPQDPHRSVESTVELALQRLHNLKRIKYFEYPYELHSTPDFPPLVGILEFDRAHPCVEWECWELERFIKSATVDMPIRIETLGKASPEWELQIEQCRATIDDVGKEGRVVNPKKFYPADASSRAGICLRLFHPIRRFSDKVKHVFLRVKYFVREK